MGERHPFRDTSFNKGDGEQVVFRLVLSSDSLDVQSEQLTVVGRGDIDEASDVVAIRLYLDSSQNGNPEATELFADEQSYKVNEGSISFTLPQAYQLTIGDAHLLITYQF